MIKRHVLGEHYIQVDAT